MGENKQQRTQEHYRENKPVGDEIPEVVQLEDYAEVCIGDHKYYRYRESITPKYTMEGLPELCNNGLTPVRYVR